MELFRQLLAVAFVLALAAGAAWWLRRGARLGRLRPGAGGRLRRLELLERLPLGPQQSLCLVRCGDRALTVLLYAGGGLLVENRPVEEFEPCSEAAPPVGRPAVVRFGGQP
jgi:hypothetical protein